MGHDRLLAESNHVFEVVCLRGVQVLLLALGAVTNVRLIYHQRTGWVHLTLTKVDLLLCLFTVV